MMAPEIKTNGCGNPADVLLAIEIRTPHANATTGASIGPTDATPSVANIEALLALDGIDAIYIATPTDLHAIERTGGFRGRYHVLHGVLSPLEKLFQRQERPIRVAVLSAGVPSASG